MPRAEAALPRAEPWNRLAWLGNTTSDARSRVCDTLKISTAVPCTPTVLSPVVPTLAESVRGSGPFGGGIVVDQCPWAWVSAATVAASSAPVTSTPCAA